MYCYNSRYNQIEKNTAHMWICNMIFCLCYGLSRNLQCDDQKWKQTEPFPPNSAWTCIFSPSLWLFHKFDESISRSFTKHNNLCKMSSHSSPRSLLCLQSWNADMCDMNISHLTAKESMWKWVQNSSLMISVNRQRSYCKNHSMNLWGNWLSCTFFFSIFPCSAITLQQNAWNNWDKHPNTFRKDAFKEKKTVHTKMNTFWISSPSASPLDINLPTPAYLYLPFPQYLRMRMNFEPWDYVNKLF